MDLFASASQLIDCSEAKKVIRAKTELLFNYEACVRNELGLDRSYFDLEEGKEIVAAGKIEVGGRVKVIQKGKAWVRDGGEFMTSKWAERDFMFHGWKAE